MPRSVRFSDEVDEALMRRAASAGRSVSWVVQRAVEEFLERGGGGPEPGAAVTTPAVPRGVQGVVRGRDLLSDRQAALNKRKGAA